jgi:hypothetical protein
MDCGNKMVRASTDSSETSETTVVRLVRAAVIGAGLYLGGIESPASFEYLKEGQIEITQHNLAGSDSGEILVTFSPNQVDCTLEISRGPDLLGNTSRLLENAEALAPQLKNPAVRSQLYELLPQLQSEVLTFGVEGAPSFMAAEDESGACVLEWSYRGRRLGFSLEPKKAESGWYLVGSRESGRVSAYGNIALMEVGWLIRTIAAT